MTYSESASSFLANCIEQPITVVVGQPAADGSFTAAPDKCFTFSAAETHDLLLLLQVMIEQQEAIDWLSWIMGGGASV